MSLLARRRIRLAMDAAKDSSTRAKDLRTEATPELWKGNDVQFEIGIFFDAALVTDLSNIVSLTIKVKSAGNMTGDALMSKTVTSFSAITAETWDDGTAQHALVPFASSETNIAAGAYKLCVYVLTNDDPGREITLGVTDFAVVEDGSNGEADSQANAGQAYTKQDADARYVQKHADQAFMQFANGTWYHYEVSTALWYPLTVVIQDGVPVLSLGEGVASL